MWHRGECQVPGLCARTIRVTRTLLRRGHIPGAGHAVAKTLLFRAGSPAGWVDVSKPRRETSTHVPSAIGFSGVAAAWKRESGGMQLANPGAVSRHPETLHFPICSVTSHRMAMRRHVGVGHVGLHP